MLNSLQNIWHFVSPHKKKLSIYQLIFSTFVSQIEIINIGILSSFLNSIEKSDSDFGLDLFNNYSTSQLGLICIFSTIIVMVLTTFNTICLSKLGASIGKEISLKVFKKQIFSEWQLQNDTDISDKISDYKFSSTILGGVFVPLFEAFSSLISSLAILFSIIFFGGKYALLLIFFIGISYLIISFIFSKRLNLMNKRIVILNQLNFSCLNDSFNNSRINCSSDLGKENYNNFKKLNKELQGYSSDFNIISNLPRTLIEGIGIALATSIGLILIFTNNENSLSIVGVLALGIQRLLPRAHLLYRSVSAIKSCKSMLKKIIQSLKLKQDPVLNYIQSKNLGDLKKPNSLLSISKLKYNFKSGLQLSFDDFSVNLGEYVGLIGKSGSGKSTLIDLLSGFRKPSSGDIFVEGGSLWGKGSLSRRAIWRYSLGIVEQDPYLFRDSVLSNIILSKKTTLNSLELIKLKKCIEVSCVDKFFSFKEIIKGDKLKIKEFGKELSGGMKQRIGLCRALYRSQNWIFIDEGTSAIDMATESLIIDGLKSEFNNYGIVASAHRESMIKSFDKCIKI